MPKMECIDLSYFNDNDFEQNETLLDTLFESLKEDSSIRHELVNVTIDNKNVKEFNLGQLILSLIVSKPFLLFNRKKTLDDLFFVSGKENAANKLKKYYDKIIKTFDNEELLDSLKETIAFCLEQLSSMMYKFNVKKGNTINLYDLTKILREHQDVQDIINFEIDEKLQFHDMEESVKEKCNELLSKFYEIGNNCYVDIITSVSLRQFQQVFVNISLKPDLYGKIYPKPINTSFLRGMRNEVDYFINAMGARKALITNAKLGGHYMGNYIMNLL